MASPQRQPRPPPETRSPSVILRRMDNAVLSRAAGADLLGEADLAGLMAQRDVLDGELSEARRDMEQLSDLARRARAAIEAERARRQHLQEVLEQQVETCARLKGEREALRLVLQELR